MKGESSERDGQMVERKSPRQGEIAKQVDAAEVESY